jgi:DNA-binding response OmpR family regulator
LLPEIDGLTVLRTLREGGNRSHVLILTAKDSVEDRVKGLRSGADDYLVKPFDFDELLARVEALARRRYDTKDPKIHVGDLTVDTASKKALLHGVEIDLTPREYALLEYLAFRRGEPVSRLELEDHIYEDRKQVLSNAIDSAVCTLRAKLDARGAQRLVHTRRGVGYVLEVRSVDPSAAP